MTISKEQNFSRKTYTCKDYMCNRYLFDGIENAGYGIHEPDVHRWYDNNGSGIYVAYSDEKQSYSTKNSFVISNYSSNVTLMSKSDKDHFVNFDSDFTFECVMRSQDLPTIGIYFDDAVDKIWHSALSIRNGMIDVQVNGGRWFFNVANLLPQKKSYVAMVRRDYMAFVYVNGICVNGKTVITHPLKMASGISMNRNSEYNIVRVSDYALSDEDIMNNYIIDRVRFQI